ncbi:hypothetical protein Tco_1183926 [Tanacetum coccineum]
MIAPGSSRYSSNDMVHNHYLEEAKKRYKKGSRNSRTYCVTTKTVPIAEHSRNSRSFSDYKHFVCSTCQKCVFNANHDSCVTKFLNEVNSRAKVPSHKTTTRYKPVEQTSVAKKPERQIPKRHKSSIKKTSVVHEKTMTPRSCLRWKPTGKIFKTVGLRWVPTGKIFTYSTTNVDSEPQNGSNDDITNQYECNQTLDVSAGTLNIHAAMTSVHNSSGLALPRQMTSDHNSSELEIHDHSNELSRSKLVPKVVPPADKTDTSRQELELLFHHHITMLRSKLEYKFQDKENSEDIFSFGSALEDFISVVFVHDRNIKSFCLLLLLAVFLVCVQSLSINPSHWMVLVLLFKPFPPLMLLGLGEIAKGWHFKQGKWCVGLGFGHGFKGKGWD